jgi:RNA polymerase sigma factor (sigma-70 family)
MPKDQPYLPRPGVDEVVIVDEMMRDQDHAHWEECYAFVKRWVHTRAKNIPSHLWDDMVQEIMFKITKYLPHFRFQCTLKTWLNTIIEHHIADEYRKLRNEGSHLLFSINPPGEIEGESPVPDSREAVSTEDAFEVLEQIRIGLEALLEYANTHSNPVRNRHIIRMVCFEGKTYEEAAIAAGCNAPVVGNVVREAQRYARERWNDYR